MERARWSWEETPVDVARRRAGEAAEHFMDAHHEVPFLGMYSEEWEEMVASAEAMRQMGIVDAGWICRFRRKVQGGRPSRAASLVLHTVWGVRWGLLSETMKRFSQHHEELLRRRASR